MSDEPQTMGNDDIARLLADAGANLPLAGQPAPEAAAAAQPVATQPPSEQAAAPSAPAAAQQPAAAAKRGPKPAGAGREEAIASADVELLLKQAQEAIASIDEPHVSAAAAVRAFQLDEFAGAAPSTERATLELIRDVELDLRIEFGRTQMYLEDVLKLRKGSVVPLDKLAGDPVDIFVNGRLIAKGEVLVLNDNFCVRVAELITGERTT
ncbi:MAG TPA: flagellar motor switch protein FliN [Pirellulales bacterium]|nr:flagellar motor switch protein FliN [Pirellulales bacterium]